MDLQVEEIEKRLSERATGQAGHARFNAYAQEDMRYLLDELKAKTLKANAALIQERNTLKIQLLNLTGMMEELSMVTSNLQLKAYLRDLLQKAREGEHGIISGLELMNENHRLEDLHEPIKDTYCCERCGRRDGLDSILTNTHWATITEGELPPGTTEVINGRWNILCLWCMDELCEQHGIKAEVRLHFAGRALHGGSATEEQDEHLYQQMGINRMVREKYLKAEATATAALDLLKELGEEMKLEFERELNIRTQQAINNQAGVRITLDGLEESAAVREKEHNDLLRIKQAAKKAVRNKVFWHRLNDVSLQLLRMRTVGNTMLSKEEILELSDHSVDLSRLYNLILEVEGREPDAQIPTPFIQPMPPVTVRDRQGHIVYDF